MRVGTLPKVLSCRSIKDEVMDQIVTSYVDDIIKIIVIIVLIIINSNNDDHN
jgi:hypothetical protein